MARSFRFAALFALVNLASGAAFAGPADDFAAALKADLQARGLKDVTIAASADEGDTVVLSGLRAVSPKSASDTLTMGEVRIIKPKDGAVLADNAISIKSYKLTHALNTETSFPEVTMTGVSGPAGALIAAQFFPSPDIADFAIEGMKAISAKTIHAPAGVAKSQRKPGLTQTTRYQDLRMSDLVDGRYGKVSVGKFESEDETQKMSFDGGEATNVDALVAIRDAKSTLMVMETIQLNNLSVKKQDDALVKVEALRMNRIAILPGEKTLHALLAPTLENLDLSDESEEATKKRSRAAIDFAAQFMQRFSVDDITMSGVKQDKEGEPVSIGTVTIAGVKNGRIETISFKNLENLSEEQPVRMGEFRLEGLDFSKLVALAQRYITGEFDDNTIVKAIMRDGIPSLKRVLIEDMLTRDDNENPIAIDHISLAFGDMIGVMPSRITTKVRNFKMVVEDKKDVQTVMGGETATLHMTADMIYDPDAKTIEIRDAEINADDVGSLNYALKLANVDRSIFENIQDRYMSLMSDTQFTSMSAKFVNLGMVERTMAAEAKKKKVKLPALKKKMLMDINKGIKKDVKDADLAAQLQEAAKQFMEAPKSLKVTIEPRDAMSLFMAVMALGQIKENETAGDVASQFKIRIEANQ